MNTVIDAISWIPPEWTVPLLFLKGGVAIMGVLLLVFHMNAEWNRMQSNDQRARYLLLLGYAVLTAGGTSEQLKEGVELSYRHLGSLLLCIALVLVTAQSIRNSRRRGAAQERAHVRRD